MFKIGDIVYLKVIEPSLRQLYTRMIIRLSTGGTPLYVKEISRDTFVYLSKLRDGFLVGVITKF